MKSNVHLLALVIGLPALFLFGAYYLLRRWNQGRSVHPTQAKRHLHAQTSHGDTRQHLDDRTEHHGEHLPSHSVSH